MERFSPHLGFWADQRASSALGFESILQGILDEVMSRAAGYQAFMASWAWTPYRGVDSTPYEICCGVHGQCTTLREWCAKFLRGVSGEMWLGPSLRERLSKSEELEAVATLRPVGGCLHLSKKPDATLDALELALEPLLPSAEDWKNGMNLLYGRKLG